MGTSRCTRLRRPDYAGLTRAGVEGQAAPWGVGTSPAAGDVGMTRAAASHFLLAENTTSCGTTWPRDCYK